MVRFLFLIFIIILILFILNNRSKKINNNNSNIYKKLIILTVFLGIIFLLVTSGKLIIPQILQILKIALPFLTKYIGI